MNQHRTGRSKSFKAFSIILLIIFGIGLSSWALYRWIERPRYIHIQIPSPISYLPRGDWLYTQFATNTFTDDHTRYFVTRMETSAFGKVHDQEHGFDSWESVLNYFDEYLSKMNWQLYSSKAVDPCVIFLPESEFLPRGEGGYVAYRRHNTKDYVDEPTICLAIWPVYFVGEQVKRFEIVLVTINPSTFTQWKSILD
jgi:hypothetical protein